MNLIGIKARKAGEYKITTKVKNKVLSDYAKLIKKEKKFIIIQNLKDVNYAKKKGLKENLIKRLHLNDNEVTKIMGHHSNEIEKLLGYVAKSEVIHKDDMVEV